MNIKLHGKNILSITMIMKITSRLALFFKIKFILFPSKHTTIIKTLLNNIHANTTIKLKIDTNDIESIIILDLETRRKEIGNKYKKDGICCLEMHTFGHDVLYIVELKNI